MRFSLAAAAEYGAIQTDIAAPVTAFPANTSVWSFASVQCTNLKSLAQEKSYPLIKQLLFCRHFMQEEISACFVASGITVCWSGAAECTIAIVTHTTLVCRQIVVRRSFKPKSLLFNLDPGRYA